MLKLSLAPYMGSKPEVDMFGKLNFNTPWNIDSGAIENISCNNHLSWMWETETKEPQLAYQMAIMSQLKELELHFFQKTQKLIMFYIFPILDIIYFPSVNLQKILIV